MNTHLKQLWAAMKLPKNFKKSYKFFCLGLDIRVRELLEARNGSIDVDYVKTCAMDHANYPKCICSHPEDTEALLADREMTVANLIIDFRAGKAHVCAGPPCQGEYYTYSI